MLEAVVLLPFLLALATPLTVRALGRSAAYVNAAALAVLAGMLARTAPAVLAGTDVTSTRAWLDEPRIALALGLAALLLPQLVQHPFFDTRWTNWVGLVTRKPVTEDWVPLLPWLGVMWWGAAAGDLLRARRRAWLAGALPGLLRPLAALGRWPLSFYMLHQPVLIALVAGLAMAARMGA